MVTVSTNASSFSSSSSFVQRWASLFSLAFFVSSVAFVLSFQKKKRKRKKNPTKDERKREGEIDLKNAKKSQKVVERFVFLLCIFRAQHIKHAPLLRKESVVQEPYI